MTDVYLLDELRQYPEEGCRLLLDEYTPLVLAVVRRRLGDQSPQEHEELVSDIMFAFYQKRDQIDLSRGTIRSLLVTMAVRMCIDRYRQQSGKPQEEDLETAEETVADTRPTPDRQAELNEEKSALMRAIKSLGEPDSSILLWKFYFGETAAAIAKRLCMQTGAIEMRISRAKEKIRKKLGGDAE